MKKNTKILTMAIISAAITGLAYWIAATQIFNNPALAASNTTMVGIVMVVKSFIVSYLVMKIGGKLL